MLTFPHHNVLPSLSKFLFFCANPAAYSDAYLLGSKITYFNGSYFQVIVDRNEVLKVQKSAHLAILT